MCDSSTVSVGVHVAKAKSAINLQGSGEASTGIWSLAWSPAVSEVAAGTSQPGVIVYDLASCRTILAALCHQDDVNAVTYADPSGNVILSGSDDTRIFVHDRCGALPCCCLLTAMSPLATSIRCLLHYTGCLDARRGLRHVKRSQCAANVCFEPGR
jgi:WD40 repeat protein